MWSYCSVLEAVVCLRPQLLEGWSCPTLDTVVLVTIPGSGSGLSFWTWTICINLDDLWTTGLWFSLSFRNKTVKLLLLLTIILSNVFFVTTTTIIRIILFFITIGQIRSPKGPDGWPVWRFLVLWLLVDVARCCLRGRRQGWVSLLSVPDWACSGVWSVVSEVWPGVSLSPGGNH